MTEALKLYGPAVGNLAVTIGLYFHLKSQIKVAQTPPLEDIYARLDEIEKILKGIVPALQNHDKVIRAITTRPPPQNSSGENGGEKKGKAKSKKGTPKTTKVSEAETEVEEDLDEGVTEVEEDTRPKPKRGKAAKRGTTKGKAKTKATPKAKKLTKEEAEEIWVEGQAPDDDKIDDILGLNETTGAEEEEIELEYEITESEPPSKAKAKSQSKSFRKPKSS